MSRPSRPRAAAGLEGAAAEHGGAGGLDGRGGLPELLAAFDGAGAGHDDDAVAAHGDAVNGDYGVGGMEVAAGQFERLQDGHHGLHAVQQRQGMIRQGAVVADDADDGTLFPSGEVRPEAKVFDLLHHPSHLQLGGALAHDNDHFLSSPSVAPVPAAGLAAGPARSGLSPRALPR
jgi:hypothetical protein